jgi:hypothetical protein
MTARFVDRRVPAGHRALGGSRSAPVSARTVRSSHIADRRAVDGVSWRELAGYPALRAANVRQLTHQRRESSGSLTSPALIPSPLRPASPPPVRAAPGEAS